MVNLNKMQGDARTLEIRLIEYCITNIEKGTLEAINELKKLWPQAKVQEWGCLGHCQQCFRKPYVYINETVVVEASTASGLVAAVKRVAAEDYLPQRP